MACVFDVKDSADADGTEVALEQRLPPVFAHIREQLLCYEDGWYACLGLCLGLNEKKEIVCSSGARSAMAMED
jgi:hypothetical protein